MHSSVITVCHHLQHLGFTLISPLSFAQGEHWYGEQGLHANLSWAFRAPFIRGRPSSGDSCVDFYFLAKMQNCVLSVKKKIGSQRGSTNTTCRGERKNRPLIESAIAISQKRKLLLKVSCNDSALCFCFSSLWSVWKTYFYTSFYGEFKVQLAVLNFSPDILSDKMRKHISQASSVGCQGNISENGVCAPGKHAHVFACHI